MKTCAEFIVHNDTEKPCVRRRGHRGAHYARLDNEGSGFIWSTKQSDLTREQVDAVLAEVK